MRVVALSDAPRLLGKGLASTTASGALETWAIPPAKGCSLNRNQSLDRGSWASARAPERTLLDAQRAGRSGWKCDIRADSTHDPVGLLGHRLRHFDPTCEGGLRSNAVALS